MLFGTVAKACIILILKLSQLGHDLSLTIHQGITVSVFGIAAISAENMQPEADV